MDFSERLNFIIEQVIKSFSSLSYEQLNWKMDLSKWSIAQCLEHLIVSNSTYFPVFDQVLEGTYTLPVTQRFNPLSKLFGPMMIKTLGPHPTIKFKSPKIFTPSSGNIPSSILQDFYKHQEVLKSYFRKLLQLDIDRIVITSPVNSFISYNLNHALQIITGHEQRHINQALNVLNHPNFPK